MSHPGANHVRGGAGRDILYGSNSDDATETRKTEGAEAAQKTLACMKQCLQNPSSKILCMITKATIVSL